MTNRPDINWGLSAPEGAKPKFVSEAQAATFHARLNTWLDALTANANEGRDPATQHTYAFEIDPPRKGQRYARVVMLFVPAGAPEAKGQRSVHAFYDLRTGDVYKAATWKAPAKIVRYNLLDLQSFTTMLLRLDWAGGYLYIR